MINAKAVEKAIYFQNNGEIDLLTGSISPTLFNSMVKRDIDLARRSGNQLAIFSLKVNLPKLIEIKYKNFSINEVRLDIEELLVEVHFKLKNLVRSSDCISRVSSLGFWILINSANSSDLSQLEKRINDLFSEFLVLVVIPREGEQDFSSWYQAIDHKHFSI
jgi:GGDEF domain-containing protein